MFGSVYVSEMHVPRDEAFETRTSQNAANWSGGDSFSEDDSFEEVFKYLEARQDINCNGSSINTSTGVLVDNYGSGSIAEKCRSAASRLTPADAGHSVLTQSNPTEATAVTTSCFPVVPQATVLQNVSGTPSLVWRPEPDEPMRDLLQGTAHVGADLLPWELYSTNHDAVKELMDAHVRKASEEREASAILACFWTMIRNSSHLTPKEQWFEILEFVRYVAVMHSTD